MARLSSALGAALLSTCLLVPAAHAEDVRQTLGDVADSSPMTPSPTGRTAGVRADTASACFAGGNMGRQPAGRGPFEVMEYRFPRRGDGA